MCYLTEAGISALRVFVMLDEAGISALGGNRVNTGQFLCQRQKSPYYLSWDNFSDNINKSPITQHEMSFGTRLKCHHITKIAANEEAKFLNPQIKCMTKITV